MKINALSVITPKGNLEPFEYEKEIGVMDVLISVKYCSVAGGDVCFIDNLWGDTIYPLVPSSEVFGVVEQIGSEVKDLKVGDFVGTGYQMSSCGECEYCKAGKEQFCKSQKVLQINGFGGTADYLIFDSRFTFKIPKKLQSPEYVPLMCSGLTPFSAIKASGIKEGMKIGLVGVGNLGHLALQILNKHGAGVTVFTHSIGKEDVLKKLGATKIVDSTNSQQLENEKGLYDIIYSTSSGTLDWSQYIKALKPEGTLVFIGLPAENISFHAALLADYAQRKIMGSYVGSRKDMIELLDFASKTDIRAVVETYPFSEANEVVAKVRSKQTQFSVVLTRD